jgi:transposase
MPAPLPIRPDRNPAELRRLARRERDGRVSARLLALANALEGLPREQAARLAGMTGQTLGDWVHRYDEAGVEGLRDRPRPGRPCALDDGQQAALKALVLRGPRLARDGCVAWRLRDLCAVVERRFGVRYSAAMGLFLAELAHALPARTHAVLVLDRAGWHVSADLQVPPNLTLVHLPPYSPELNPVEKVWQHLRDRWLSHRVLAGGYAAVLDAACQAWDAVRAGPGRLRSLTSYPWLPTSVAAS